MTRNGILLCGVIVLALACQRLHWDDVRTQAAGARQEVMPAPGETVANPPGRSFITESEALSPHEQLATFTVPPGFDVQLVAAEPYIQKPMQLAFDEKGRLLVSMSTNYPLGPPPEGPLSDRVNAIEIDGVTGAAIRISNVADGFNICSGIETLPGGRIILGHAPDILLLSDPDGDGTADSREVLYTGFDRADTHELPNSFTWGPDGWLYMLQGHVNESDVRDRNGNVTPIYHGGVFRFQPDGSRIETFAPGMSNPWGLAFDNRYNLFGSDCESRPLWQIVEGFRYQGFLQPGDPLGFAPHITEDSHGASGFAGLVSYNATAYPAIYRDCLYLGGPITHRIHRDALLDEGSTRFADRQPDLLMSSDPWFRPVDIELGPDGALYVADWYNKIIAHVEVPLDHPDRDKQRGRIWRIVYRGTEAEWNDRARRREIAKQFEGPMATDWSAASRDELFAALKSPNGWIRRMASQQIYFRIAKDAAPAIRRTAMRQRGDSLQRAEALWLLYRFGALESGTLMKLLDCDDARTRAQAVRIAGLLGPNTVTTDALLARVDDADPAVRREALLALGKWPSLPGFGRLIKMPSADESSDTLFEYALRMAIRDHLQDDGVMKAAGDLPSDERFLGILAAAQTPLAAKRIVECLDNDGVPEIVLGTALETVLLYGDEATIRTHFLENPHLVRLNSERSRVYGTAVLRNSGRARRAFDFDFDPILTVIAYKLAQSTLPDDYTLALEIAAQRRIAALVPIARETLWNEQAGDNARRYAATLLIRCDHAHSHPSVLSVLADTRQSPALRRSIAEELGDTMETPDALDGLLAALAHAPLEVGEGALERIASHPAGVTLLLDAVDRGALTPARLNTRSIRSRMEGTSPGPEILARYENAVRGAVSVDYEQKQLIERYLVRFAEREINDVKRGQAVFEANCAVCHRIGGMGAMIGPNLDGVGNRGLARILQDVLIPSHDVDPAFRTTVIRTSQGLRAEGIVAEESLASLVIVDSDGWETPVNKDDIEERRQVWTSPMPSDFGTVIPENDFLNLVAFLLNPPERITPMTEPAAAF